MSLLALSTTVLAGTAVADEADNCEPQISPDLSWVEDCIPVPPNPLASGAPGPVGRAPSAGASG